jgi:hypothetical protein
MITGALLIKLLLTYGLIGILILFIGIATIDNYNNKLQKILKRLMLCWVGGLFFFLLALIWLV